MPADPGAMRRHPAAAVVEAAVLVFFSWQKVTSCSVLA